MRKRSVLLAVMFQRRPQKSPSEVGRYGSSKCGEMGMRITATMSDAGPSLRKPRKA